MKPTKHYLKEERRGRGKGIWWRAELVWGTRCTRNPLVLLTYDKILKIGTGRVPQAVKHLPSKHKALSSNPSTARGEEWQAAFFSFLTKTCYINQANLKPIILLSQLSQYWDYSCIPICQATLSLEGRNSKLFVDIF
jgi:hypothetical protein